MTINEDAYRALYPEKASEPAIRSVREFAKLITLFHESHEIARIADRLLPAGVIEVALKSGAVDTETLQRYGSSPRTDQNWFAQLLASFGPLFPEMVHCRAADNYMTFLVELMTLVFRTDPRTLVSDQKVAVSQVLECSNRDELVSSVGRAPPAEPSSIRHSTFDIRHSAIDNWQSAFAIRHSPIAILYLIASRPPPSVRPRCFILQIGESFHARPVQHETTPRLPAPAPPPVPMFRRFACFLLPVASPVRLWAFRLLAFLQSAT